MKAWWLVCCVAVSTAAWSQSTALPPETTISYLPKGALPFEMGELKSGWRRRIEAVAYKTAWWVLFREGYE